MVMSAKNSDPGSTSMPPPPPTPEQPRSTTGTGMGKSQRVLACVLCQQRKIKCDRRFPCQHCTKAGAKCIPAALIPRQRRRRFPERELLDKLRHYEELLRLNNISFEPLHPGHSSDATPNANQDPGGSDDANAREDDGNSPNSKPTKMVASYRPKSVWDAMNQKPQISDDEYENDEDDDQDGGYTSFSHGITTEFSGTLHEATVRKAMDLSFQSDDHLLFGSPSSILASTSTLHPPPAQIFRLWNLYLDNVNPLFKVTHIPTLQTRILEAAADVTNIDPILEALMFSIYSVTIKTLDEEECFNMFGASDEDLSNTFQAACQHCLNKCGLLRTMERDCLTAYFLYLVSARKTTDPRSISSMLGVAIRIAQRMGINVNSMYAKCPPLETEMRRRLWWALVMFDARICEQSNWRATELNPTWDCTIPSNIPDSDLRPEMKSLPHGNDRPTEAVFAVIRSKICEYIRHSPAHLDFCNPALKPIAEPSSSNDPITALEKTVEEEFLQYCNPENPLHFMTIWTTRYNLAHTRLMTFFANVSKESIKQTNADRNAAFVAALGMLESGTMLLKSPLSKGFLWFVQLYFPFLAYMYIVKDLTRRPLLELAGRAWSAINEDYETRRKLVNMDKSPLLGIFSSTILAAWEARERAVRERGLPPEPLAPMLLDARRRASDLRLDPETSNKEHPGTVPSQGSVPDLADLMPMDMNLGLPFDMGQESPSVGFGQYTAMPGQAWMDIDMSNIDWTTIDWNSVPGRSW